MVCTVDRVYFARYYCSQTSVMCIGDRVMSARLIIQSASPSVGVSLSVGMSVSRSLGSVGLKMSTIRSHRRGLNYLVYQMHRCFFVDINILCIIIRWVYM